MQVFKGMGGREVESVSVIFHCLIGSVVTRWCSWHLVLSLKLLSSTWVRHYDVYSLRNQDPALLPHLLLDAPPLFLGFPRSSVGKESTSNAGDPSSIPRVGRSGEGIGYPLPYSWTSLVTQLVKNLPAMQETWVQSLGWEDPLEKVTTTHSSILAWRIPWTT